MDPTDQFFRKKLVERQYEYKEAYWEDAERLIEQRERHRRRRTLWWWLTGVLLLAGLGAATWRYLGNEDSGHTVPGAFRIDTPPSGRMGPNTTATDWFLEMPAQRAEPENNGRKGNIASGAEQKGGAGGPKTQEEGTAFAGRPGTSLPEKRISTGRTSGHEPPAGTALEEESGMKKMLPAAPSKPGKEPEEAGKGEPVALEPGKGMEINSLALLRGPVQGRPASLGVAPAVSAPPVRLRKRLSWALTGAATLNPSPGKTLLGGTAGLQVSRRVGEKWTLALGGQYRLRGGTFGPSQESRIVAYRFGREEQRYSLQPNRLHYAEASLLAEWPVKRHRFALGLGWSYLLGIEGSLDGTRKEEFASGFGAPGSQDRGWLDEEGCKKQFWTGRAAYCFQIAGRWSLGAEMQYVPGSILQKGRVGEPGTLLLKESGPVIFDLWIKYRL